MIPPGGSGTLVAKVTTGANQNGTLAKTIRVVTDAPGASELLLKFTLKVSAPIVVIPTGRIIVAGIEGRPVHRLLLMRRNDGLPLELGEIDNGLSGMLEVSFGRVGTGHAAPPVPASALPGDVWLQLAVPEGSAAVDREGVVTVATNHVDRAQVEIPVLVRTMPLIAVTPETVRLQVGADPGSSAAVVRLAHNGGRPFRVLAVESWRPDLVTARAVGVDAPSIFHHVRVEAVDGASTAAGGVGGAITVRTDDPARPTVTFRVEVVPEPV